jgi:hypothetical protein
LDLPVGFRPFSHSGPGLVQVGLLGSGLCVRVQGSGFSLDLSCRFS